MLDTSAQYCLGIFQAFLFFVAVSGGTPQTAEWWQPTAEKPLALHWVLGGPLNIDNPKQMGLRDFAGNPLPEPDIYDIDGEANTGETVRFLHNRGKKVICYFDAGVYETYRQDAYKFQALTPQIWGKDDLGWPGSYWLDIRRISELEPIMKARMQMCKDKGFDAVDPDEINGWENDSGFPLTFDDQLAYNRALAGWAHDLGLSIGQKGDIAQTRQLADYFDFMLNEECFQYDECTDPWDSVTGEFVVGLQRYVEQNKAVFIAEYKNYNAAKWAKICATSTAQRFNTTRWKLGMPNNGGRMPCSTASTW
ncbi:endo alpha-1,4 polygalactosaminidase [Sphingopyxis sp. JAI128]|uniref:endo alpha-1,4 polygalactosaminidase n=1 Tax=Sphingopyxis sp. JAI128 TaxID=2723066 RepID=UPI0016223C77|nr:endo alpha-1,4 polygalactosaminidase [Sphingopyxis sp. JAI128]MBB6426893.1 hypothetical protein [Sphingopyxis sp. JAI128]